MLTPIQSKNLQIIEKRIAKANQLVVENFGMSFIVSNFHSLKHIVELINRLGPL